MATFATAKELSAYLRKVTVSQYEPLPSSIHTVLQRHGIKPITKDYNGRLVKVYDVKNAKRIISQYMYELKKEDALTNNVKDIMKHNSESVSNTSMPKPQYIPRKHGETNAMRELDRETLYEGKRIYITEEQFKKLFKRGFVNEMAL